MTTAGEKTLLEADGADDTTSVRILQAAEQLFSSKGYRGTTSREIAELAGTNLALVNYHWGSKDELWNAVQKRLLEQLLEFAVELANDVSGLERRDAIEKFVTKSFYYFENNPHVIPFIEWQVNEMRQSDWIEQAARPVLEYATNVVESIGGLDFQPVDLIIALYCLYGAISAFFDRSAIVEVLFGEDTRSYSDGFREKAIEALCLIIERFAQVEQTGQAETRSSPFIPR